MQAIVTKYHGPTDRLGSRYSATSAAARIYVSIDYALNSDANHARACKTLAVKLAWCGKYCMPMIGGHLPDGRMAWIMSGDLSPRVE